jgi:hypothetical protein
MSTTTAIESRSSFLAALREQRWDDHRYYHQSRVNQSLHLVSALSFLAAYVLLPIHPIWAAGLGWLVSMGTRQSGHFFFEPRGYDHVNDASHEHKESIKVGYNLQRKVVLIAAWALTPVLIWQSGTCVGLFEERAGWYGYLWNLSLLWIWLGAIAILLRTLWLCWRRDVQTGLVWATKIATDPFHDVMLYHKAPLALLRGEWIDPMHDVTERQRRPH